MIRERLLRQFHFGLCGWVGNHAPEGLVFQCVLRAYARYYQSSRDIGAHFDAAKLLDDAGRRAEKACEPKRKGDR